MRWIWHWGIPYKLSGKVIRKGEKLEFTATKRDGKPFNMKNLKGYKIVSAFPDINTPVCNIQTQRMDELARMYPSITFISISLDKVDTLNKWCSVRGVTHNSLILSDFDKGEFTLKSKLLIKNRGVTARGFFILDNNNRIVDMYVNKKLNGTPKYRLIKKYIQNIILSKDQTIEAADKNKKKK